MNKLTLKKLSAIALFGLASTTNIQAGTTGSVVITGTISEVVSVSVTANQNSFSITPGVAIDDQNLAIIFFSISWILVLVPFLWFSNGNSESLNLFPLEALPFFLGVVLFILHIMIDPKLGWLGYIFFLYSWLKTVNNISNSLSVNSARWLLPISISDFSDDIFNEGWILLTRNFRNGLIAKYSKDLVHYSAEITGLTRGDNKFLAFSIVYQGRIIHDPFNHNFISDTELNRLLKAPPLKISGESWPSNLIVIREEE